MGLHPPKGVPSKLMDPGVFGAICYAVYDLGTHFKEGKYAGERHEIVVIFEVPTQRIVIDEKDRPMAISKRYTFTLGAKGNLRKDLEAWRGKPFTDEEIDAFDLLKMLGKYALIQVIHKKKSDGGLVAVINSIMTLPKDMKMPNKPENPIGFFSFEDEFKKLPELMPKWVVDTIKESNEYKELLKEKPPEPEDSIVSGDVNARPPDEDEDNDLPF